MGFLDKLFGKKSAAPVKEPVPVAQLLFMGPSSERRGQSDIDCWPCTEVTFIPNQDESGKGKDGRTDFDAVLEVVNEHLKGNDGVRILYPSRIGEIMWNGVRRSLYGCVTLRGFQPFSPEKMPSELKSVLVALSQKGVINNASFDTSIHDYNGFAMPDDKRQRHQRTLDLGKYITTLDL
jgi:hypothetical protein